MSFTPTEKEIALLRALQEDLPVTPAPFGEIARKAGISEADALNKIKEWKESGHVRRFGALLAHRRAGISANGMVVWNAPEDKIQEIGDEFSKNTSVSHCYARPRFDGWDYRLYTMVHGRSREQVEAVAAELSKQSGITDYFILYSTREFKKSDTRLFFEED